MTQTIKRISITLAAVAAALLLAMSASSIVSAQGPSIQGSLCQGSGLQGDLDNVSQADCNTADFATTGESANSLVATVINIFSLVVGVISVIMIIFGGFRYITSGGASDKVTSAKNTIMYAIIGLVIVALAQFIVQFVLGKTTSL